MESQFAQSFRAKLNTYAEGLADDPAAVVALPPSVAEQVFAFLVDCACKSQGHEASHWGVRYLSRLLRAWTLPRLREVAFSKDVLEDDYVFRRFVDLLEALGSPANPEIATLLNAVLQAGMGSPDFDVREDASACLTMRRARRAPLLTLASHREEALVWRRSRPFEQVPTQRTEVRS